MRHGERYEHRWAPAGGRDGRKRENRKYRGTTGHEILKCNAKSVCGSDRLALEFRIRYVFVM